jgi:hypothetical protein
MRLVLMHLKNRIAVGMDPENGLRDSSVLARAQRSRARGPAETRVVQTILHPTGRQCRGDPVGRPGGAAHAGPRRRVMWDHRARWRQGNLPRWNRRCQARGGMTDDVNPRRSHDDRIHPHPALRAGLSLARERRLFVASWQTAGSFRSAHPTEHTLPAGNVGATRWVAPGVRCTRADVFGDVGPACKTAPGRRTASPLHAVRRAPCVVARNFVGARLHRQIGAVCEPPLQHAMLHRIARWNRRCQARRGMTDDVDPQRSHDDSIRPHPALRAGLFLPGRGVSLFLR